MKWMFLFLPFVFVACVTEPKPESTEYLKPVSDAPGGVVATKITVRCHVQNEKTKKSTPCKQMNIKMINQVTKTETNESFKKGAALVTIGMDVYTAYITTSACSAVKTFTGLSAGMMIDAYFDPPCGTK